MSNFKLRHFSKPETLKSIALHRLIQFFEPYRSFFQQRGLSLVASESFDYDRLSSILMSPGEDTPEQLLDALFFVDEMSIARLFDDLMQEVQASDLDIAIDDDMTAADLAVEIWLQAPDILEKLHAEQFLTRPKSFQAFLSAGPELPDLHYPADAVKRFGANDGLSLRILTYPPKLINHKNHKTR